jgi:hypothetical protein
MGGQAVMWALVGASGALAFDRLIDGRPFFGTLYAALCAFAVFVVASPVT